MFLLAAAVTGVTAGMFFAGRNSRSFQKSRDVFGNPLMGYAPQATDEIVSRDVSLLYVDITWRELEPREGEFAWRKIAEENRLERWRQEGKHIILRFLCDLPGEDSHMDIPDWLYEKIGQRGTWYDSEYGRGFSPDYTHETLIRCHGNAVAALGKYFGQDGFVGYVELGSLGHWGEWHVNLDAGIRPLPKEPVREQYVTPWAEAFPRAKLLMRRPFAPAAEYGMGLYNDMAGDAESTGEWMKWIRDGGAFSQTGENQALVSMREFWKTAPAGGEFTSSQSMEYLLKDNLTETLELIRASHMTFLGPKTADGAYKKGYEAVLENLGYRIWISGAKLKNTKEGIRLELIWENDGAAPMYQDWPVMVYVEDPAGHVVESCMVDMRLSELLPGTRMVTKVELETEGLCERDRVEYRILLGILDPMTGMPAVRLASDADQEDGKLVLFGRGC